MDEMIRELIGRRAKVWNEAKALLDERTNDNGAFDKAEDRETYERMNSQLAEFDARIDELVGLDQANKRIDAQRAEYEKVVRPDVVARAEANQESEWRDFIEGRRNHIDLDFRGLSVEPSRHGRSWEVRDLLSDVAASGGNTVPTSFVRSLYEHLIENSAIRQTNVRVIQTASGESIELPKTSTYGTAAIVGEGTAAAETTQSFGKLTLGAWKYGAFTQASNELLTDTGVMLTDFLARDLGRALGNASGAAFVTGSGSNAPNGVITATKASVGTSVQGTDTVIEADNLITLQYAVIEPYARNGYWFMNRSTEGAIRKLKDSNNQYLWAPGLAPGAPNLLLGRPIVTDPNMAAVASAAASVAFGDFSAYVIRDVAGVRIERSDDFAFTSDLVTWRAILRTDGDLLDTSGAIKIMDTD